jgi:hypothetical protein
VIHFTETGFARAGAAGAYAALAGTTTGAAGATCALGAGGMLLNPERGAGGDIPIPCMGCATGAAGPMPCIGGAPCGDGPIPCIGWPYPGGGAPMFCGGAW